MRSLEYLENGINMLYEISLGIWRTFPPLLLVFGTIGNLMTINVLVQRKNRNSSLAKYLTALAIADLVVLWTALPRNWLKHGFGLDVRSLSVLLCKVQLFLMHFGYHNSVLFVVLVTVERFMCTWLPLKVKRVCTPRNANVIIISVTAFVALLNSHFLFGMGHVQASMCYPSDEGYAHFLFNIWTLIALIGFSLTPFFILVILNISILIRILMMRRKSQTQVIPQAVTSAALARKRKNRQITAMLITLNVVFMICVTPLLSFMIFYIDWVLSHGDDHSRGDLELIWAIVNALFFTNYAVNFVLYFLSRSAFRKEVNAIFFRRFNSCTTICQRKIHPREGGVNVQGADENIELQNRGVFYI